MHQMQVAIPRMSGRVSSCFDQALPEGRHCLSRERDAPKLIGVDHNTFIPVRSSEVELFGGTLPISPIISTVLHITCSFVDSRSGACKGKGRPNTTPQSGVNMWNEIRGVPIWGQPLGLGKAPLNRGVSARGNRYLLRSMSSMNRGVGARPGMSLVERGPRMRAHSLLSPRDTGNSFECELECPVNQMLEVSWNILRRC